MAPRRSRLDCGLEGSGSVERRRNTSMSSTTVETEELVHEYLAAWSEKDPESIPDVLAEDFQVTSEDMTGTEIPLDIEAMQDLMREFFDAFAELDHEIHDFVAEEETAIVRLTYSGVHEGEMFGIEPTGNHVAVDEYITFHIEDGAIVDMHSLSDELSLLRQLDVELPM